jgi:hypothetical protein
MHLTPHRVAVLICLYFVVLALSYARVMPPFESADEGAHFLYVHNLLEDRALPVIASREEIAAEADPARRWAIESHQPPLYYTLGALLLAGTERADLDEYLRPNDLIFIRGTVRENPNQWLHSPLRPADFLGADTGAALGRLRLYSIALGAATLWLVYLAAWQVFGRAAPALLALLLVASIPTYVSISASVNNDNLVTLLYAAGVYWSLRMWRRGAISSGDIAAVSLILAAIALTKLNGLPLFGVVYGWLALGVWRGRFAARRVLLLIGVSLLVAGIGAGWWYVRNWELYGDPLALAATATLWGREFELAATSGDPVAEVIRIGRSFWMMMGYLHWPVYGPGWFYVYAAAASLVGLVGALVAARRQPGIRAPLLFTLLVCAVVVATLIFGTRRVDISYGRLLFPALAAFAPLMIAGWLALLGRVFGAAVILPLALMTLLAPVTTLPAAYPALQPVAAPPPGARLLVARADSLELRAFEIHDRVIEPGGEARFWLYVRGQHPANPALLATLIDPLTGERLGHTEIYPGLAPTDALDPEQLYRAALRIPVDSFDGPALSPRQALLRLAWHSPAAGHDLPLVDGGGAEIGVVLAPGPALIDPRYQPPTPQHPARAVYTAPAGRIELQGVTPSAIDLAAGDEFTLRLVWHGVGQFAADWLLTVQLMDSAGELVTQVDGEPAGYPTSAWADGTRFEDTRRLTIPLNAAPGEYHLWLGWYRLDDLVRLPARGDPVADDLYRLPVTLHVR